MSAVNAGNNAISSVFNVVSTLATTVNGAASMGNDVVLVGQLKTQAWRENVESTIASEKAFGAYLRDKEIAIKIAQRTLAIENQIGSDAKLKATYDKVLKDIAEARAAAAQLKQQQ